MSSVALGMARPRIPSVDVIGAELSAVFESGRLTNHGLRVRELERRLAHYLGVAHVCCTCNGQSAAMLALRAAGVTGGEVIVPSYTFCATPHAATWCGAQPVFADIDQRTLCLDPRDVEGRITARTVAVMPVDVYGIASDYDAFERLCDRHDLKLVIDSAPGFGTTIDNRKAGCRGDAQAFSFHATKTFTTMEGGCVSTDDADLASRVAALRNFGQSNAADCAAPGLNAKMTEVCAMVGLATLDGLDEVLQRRNQVAELFRNELSRLPGLSFADPPPGQRPTWLYFPVVVDPDGFGIDRDTVTSVLAADRLHVRSYFGLPCHHMSCYADHRTASLPVTERIAAQVVSLPIYNDMTDEEAGLFVDSLVRAHLHADEIRALAT